MSNNTFSELVLPTAKLEFEGVSREQADSIVKNWDGDFWYQQITSLVQSERRLGINRSKIPFNAIQLPNTPSGRSASKLVDALSDAVLTMDLEPETEEQRYYFRLTMQVEFWRGLILANKMLGLIPDPLPYCSLRKEQIRELSLSTNIDKAIFELLIEGENLIKEFAASQKKNYQFNAPLELFIQIMRELVQNGLAETFGKISYEPELSKDFQGKRKDPGPQKIARNEHRKWLKFLNKGFDGTPLEQKYLKELRELEWQGLWILALRETRYKKPFERLWDQYIHTLREGEELFIPTQFWERGKLLVTKRTKQKSPVKFRIDGRMLYVDWA